MANQIQPTDTLETLRIEFNSLVNDAGGTLTIVDDSSTTSALTTNTDSLIFSGGTGITSVISGDTVTFNLDNTAVSAASYGSSTAIPVITIDAQGRITAASTASLSTDLTVIDDASTSATISLANDSFKISGGTGTTSAISGDTLTINLDDTAVSAGSYGSSTAIPVLTVDAQGRITAASTATTLANVVEDTTPQLGGTLDANGNTVDMDGNELILDADADTSITADTDDQIDIKIGGSDIYTLTATTFDFNGQELILDADGDTSITSDTDDQIDFKAGNSDVLSVTTTALIPATNDAYDLGSSSKAFRDIYTGDLNLNNTHTRKNEVDGTSGSWTIQEGSTDLFLINRSNGKKYKFKLEEI